MTQTIYAFVAAVATLMVAGDSAFKVFLLAYDRLAGVRRLDARDVARDVIFSAAVLSVMASGDRWPIALATVAAVRISGPVDRFVSRLMWAAWLYLYLNPTPGWTDASVALPPVALLMLLASLGRTLHPRSPVEAEAPTSTLR